jgi:hypothetical protein
MGAQLAPSKVAKTLIESVNNDDKENKLGTILEVDEIDLENSYDNRVQGLSGNNMMEPEDDMLFDELHEGCDDQKVASVKLNIGLVRCSELIMHQTEEKAMEGGNLAKEKEIEDKTEVAVKSHALIISKNQKLLETRCSARVEQQWLDKIQEKQKSASRKRSLEGTNLSSKNSFAVLDNEYITSIAFDMGVSISDEQYECVNLMKDIEAARYAVDKVKEKACPIVEEVENDCYQEISEIPLLEWIEEDSESEPFTLVQSRKK